MWMDFSGKQSDFNQTNFHRANNSIKFWLNARLQKSVPDKIKLKLNDGAAVDPDSGNEWLDRKYSQNLPNKYYPLEIDYGQHADNDTMQKLLESANINIYSKLPKSVEELIKKIFKVKTMKEALLAL
ncbi:unnamed protein product [Rotaria magnacalcarata]|uniref:NAD(+) ADP-ribosyltransferase n=1 Tax=Rotaria magnacalcarata TaxID=392030 RepID=A0A816YBT4_9BILA|nr:unnamed protein product [Rotaria magnacalcarata]